MQRDLYKEIRFPRTTGCQLINTRPLDLDDVSYNDIESKIHCMSDEERYGVDPYTLFAARQNMRPY